MTRLHDQGMGVERTPGSSGYIICTSPRSGSTLLCTMLADTGRAGRPWSYFHRPDFMREWAEAWNLPPQEGTPPDSYDAAYLRAAAIAGRTPALGGGPVFGMRLQQAYLPSLAAMLGRVHPELPTVADRFERAFGPLTYVHLTREDKVAQAVSAVKARQTGLWHRHADGGERERSGPPAEPVFDAAAIGAEVDALTRADRAWRAWFERQAIDPLTIGYEALAADPAATVLRLCAALDIALPDDMIPTPGTARLADALSADWAARYRAGRRTDPAAS